MSRRPKLYEGKAKILYQGPEAGTVIQYFKDNATAFNNKKQGIIEGKGVMNNAISAYLMQQLNDSGLATHFLKRLNMREQLVREVEIIPVEVVVRNVAAGNFTNRMGMEEGTKLPRPIIEYYYKADHLDDPLVGEDTILCFQWLRPEELEEIYAMTHRINDFLSGLFRGVGLRLVDFKLEYGRFEESEAELPRLVLADEISPDTCRLWDMETNKKLDKDRFRRDLGGVEDAYREVARRLGTLPQNGGKETVESLPVSGEAGAENKEAAKS